MSITPCQRSLGIRWKDVLGLRCLSHSIGQMALGWYGLINWIQKWLIWTDSVILKFKWRIQIQDFFSTALITIGKIKLSKVLKSRRTCFNLSWEWKHGIHSIGLRLIGTLMISSEGDTSLLHFSTKLQVWRIWKIGATKNTQRILLKLFPEHLYSMTIVR